MIKFSERIHIGVSPETAFDFTQDYRKRLGWDTFLQKAELVGGAKAPATGVKAWCVARNGLGMETVYVSYRRPNVTAIKMTRGPYLFRSFQGSWTFREASTGTTEVIFLYSFSLRFPFSLFSGYFRRNLQRNVGRRLQDLKSCLEKEKAFKPGTSGL